MPLGRHAKKGTSKQKAGDRNTGRTNERAATTADPALAAGLAARIASARTAAAEARKRSSELKPSAEAVRARQKKRHQRDGTAPPGETPKVPVGKAAAGPTTRGGQPERKELPKDLGATAAGRHSAFAVEGRKADAARQAAERQQRKLTEYFKKHLAKGRYSIAAAALGGAARDPAVRPLLRAAGLILSEDAAMDTQLVDRIAEVSGPAGSGGTGKGAQTYDNGRAVGLVATLCAPAAPACQPARPPACPPARCARPCGFAMARTHTADVHLCLPY